MCTSVYIYMYRGLQNYQEYIGLNKYQYHLEVYLRYLILHL